MDLPTMVIVAVISLIVISILSKISKSLFRVGLLLVLAVAGYSLVTGNSLFSMMSPTIDKVLERNNILDLNVRFCSPEKEDKTICQCIVGPIYVDMEDRLGTRKLRSLADEPETMKQETLQSLQYLRPNIDQCLKDRGKDKLKILELIKNFAPIGK